MLYPHPLCRLHGDAGSPARRHRSICGCLTGTGLLELDRGCGGVPTAMIKLILAFAVSSVIAHMCTSALPFQVGSLIDGYGFSATAAGLVGFFQIGSLALSMIFFSPLTRRYRPLYVCLVGMIVAAASNLCIFVLPGSLPLICLLAVGIGIGYGLVLTAAVAAAAASADPDRVY